MRIEDMSQEEMQQEIKDLERFVEQEKSIGQVTPHIRKKLNHLRTIV